MAASVEEERNRILGRISFLLCVILAFVACISWDVFQIVEILKGMRP